MINSMSHAQRVISQSQTKGELVLFRRAYAKGKKARLFANLLNKRNQLLSIEQITEGNAIHTRYYRGVIAVPIKMIQGSEERSEDFDRSFHPLKKHNKQRWMQIAMLRLNGRSLPAIDLVQIGEIFIVVDGHHRVSVARALGEEFVDANVTRLQKMYR